MITRNFFANFANKKQINEFELIYKVRKLFNKTIVINFLQ